MKSVGLYYFSGTGNTALVANTVKETFIQLGYTVELVRIEDVMKKDLPLDLSRHEFVGIGSQVIGYGTPNLVLDFIHKLTPGRGQKVFIFRTAGGVAPINYNASKVMIRRLSRKGYDVGYEWLFSVSSNWIVRFETAVIQQLVAATQAVTVSDAEFIDATGKSLMPGLIDTHLHIFYSFEKGEQAYRALHKNQIPRQMANFLRYGVTTIKSLDDPMLQILETLANRELLPIGAKNLKGLAETGEGDGVAQ